MFTWQNFIILAIGCSLAGFVDAAAGGGGLISLPAYLMTGIPTHYLLGTNKFTACSGAFVSAGTFFQSGKVTINLIKYLLPMTAIGAITGVKVVVLIDQNFLRPIIMIMVLLVGVYTLFSKTIGTVNAFDENKMKKSNYAVGMAMAFILGFYDGFFGPGTGSFLIMFFILYYKMDFVTASGNAKALNLMSNVSALIFFAIEGKIYYMLGLPITVLVMISTWFGAKLAINKGVKVIKPIFVTMSILASLKLLFDMLHIQLFR